MVLSYGVKVFMLYHEFELKSVERHCLGSPLIEIGRMDELNQPQGFVSCEYGLHFSFER